MNTINHTSGFSEGFAANVAAHYRLEDARNAVGASAAGIDDRSVVKCSLDELSTAVGALMERVNTLESRLAPVLSTVPGPAEGGDAAPMVAVPLAAAIESQATLLRGLASRLGDFTARLGI